MKIDQFIIQARQQGYSDDQITRFVSKTAPEYQNDVTSFIKTNSYQQLMKQRQDWNGLVQQAIPIAQQYHINPAVMVGQMALESGRGSSNFATQRNNLFGYQAYDSNPDMAKSYASPRDSMIDYARLITGDPRYAQASPYYTQGNPVKQLMAIKVAGYATDPNYVQKIMALPEFQQLANQYSQ